MGKAFEKQTKTIENQGEKQVQGLKDLNPKELEAVKDNKSNNNKTSSIYNEISDKLSRERIGETYNISKKIDFNNFTYYFKDPGLALIKFIGFRGPLNIHEEIKNGNVSIEKMGEDQKQFKSKLNEITTGNPKKSKDQLYTIKDIKNLYNSRDKVIKLNNDYAKIISEVMYKTKQGIGLKILTPRQMLQRLPIALAQVKSGNNSENLLNEIR